MHTHTLNNWDNIDDKPSHTPTHKVNHRSYTSTMCTSIEIHINFWQASNTRAYSAKHTHPTHTHLHIHSIRTHTTHTPTLIHTYTYTHAHEALFIQQQGGSLQSGSVCKHRIDCLHSTSALFTGRLQLQVEGRDTGVSANKSHACEEALNREWVLIRVLRSKAGNVTKRML